ncbi:MAG TPA: tRNA 2-selenouridine(34) synthase MnmH, partial [Rhodoferax sp.]|nr:tRNA 2-selenouridine(34) synthase MnmH [Rhodoferax sp.]
VERMRASPCLDLVLPMDERVSLLMEDYDFFVRDTAHFCSRLDVLTELRGKTIINAWKEQVAAGQVRQVVLELLEQHYDPVYLQSMQRNFTQYGKARTIAPVDRSIAAMQNLARDILEYVPG